MTEIWWRTHSCATGRICLYLKQKTVNCELARHCICICTIFVGGNPWGPVQEEKDESETARGNGERQEAEVHRDLNSSLLSPSLLAGLGSGDTGRFCLDCLDDLSVLRLLREHPADVWSSKSSKWNSMLIRAEICVEEGMRKEPELKNFRLQSGYRATAKASAFQLPPSHQRNSGNLRTILLMKKSEAVRDFAFHVGGASPWMWSSLNSVRAISLICSRYSSEAGPPLLEVIKASLRVVSLRRCRVALYVFHSFTVQKRTFGKYFRSKGSVGAGMERGDKMRALSLHKEIARPVTIFPSNSDIIACKWFLRSILNIMGYQHVCARMCSICSLFVHACSKRRVKHHILLD